MHPLEPIVLASNNLGKVREVRQILEGYGLTVTALAEMEDPGGQEVAETGETFLENAIIKARWAAEHFGRAALGDDSGLEVDGLNGGPGVRSARFSGPDATTERNNAKLVAMLAGVGDPGRNARFRCVVVLFLPDSVMAGTPVAEAQPGQAATAEEAVPGGRDLAGVDEGVLARVEGGMAVWFTGTLEGRIVDQARGTGGFGYDPHFFLPEHGCTVAELPFVHKNALSHRGQAFRKAGRFIAGLTASGPIGSDTVSF